MVSSASAGWPQSKRWELVRLRLGCRRKLTCCFLSDEVPLFWREESVELHKFLDGWLEEKDDNVARRAFVTGPPGTGKSCGVLHWMLMQADTGKACLWLHHQPLGGHAVVGIRDRKAFTLDHAVDVSKTGLNNDQELQRVVQMKWDIIVYDGLTQEQVKDSLAIPLELGRKIEACRFIYVGSDRLWIKMEAKQGKDFIMPTV